MVTSRQPAANIAGHAGTARLATAALAVITLTTLLSACGSDGTAKPITSSAAGGSATSSPTDTAESAPASAGAGTTLGGPVSVQPTGTSGASTLDSARGSVVASVVGGALGAGITLDATCVAGVVAQLSDGDVALLAANLENPTSPPPTLSTQGEALAEELGACAQIEGDTVIGGDGSVAQDICNDIDVAALAPLNDSLGAGVAVRTVGPYGPGDACEFTGDAGSRVTVTLTRGADFNLWEEEITDGDGLGDGSLQRGIGELAAVGVGFAAAVVGADLIEVSVFPTFDVPSADLVQGLSDVVDTFPF